MGFNMYNQIDNIRQNLKKQGYMKNIPEDIFCRSLMILFGMKKKTAMNWIYNFKAVGFIDYKEDKVNFIIK